MDPYSSSNRDQEFTARYLEYLDRALDRFEFWAVDQRGIIRTHRFGSGYVPLTLGPRDSSDQMATGGARANDALADCDRAIIRGVAGSGKSTLLRWLAVQTIRHQRGPADFHQHASAGQIPFLIELGHFVDGRLPKLDDLVPETLRARMPPGWATRTFDDERALLFIDGLDEVEPGSQELIEQYVANLSALYPRYRCIVTTRPSAVMEQWWVDQGFSRFDLLPMSRERFRTFVQGWHEVVKGDYRDDPDQQRWVDDREADLLATLSNAPALQTMAGNPLLCGLLCALHMWRGGSLPEGRNEILEESINLLLRRRYRRISGPHGGSAIDIRLGTDEQLKLLQRLAFWMIANGERVLTMEEAPRRIGSLLAGLRNQDEDRDRVLRYMAVQCGVLREQTNRSLEFVHRIFCEYLAAREVMDEGFMGLMLRNVDDQDWHNVVIMAGVYARPSEARAILEHLLQGGRARQPEQRVALILLAAAILEQLTVPNLTVSGKAATGPSNELVRNALAELIPPRTLEAVGALVSAGPFVLDLLPGPQTLHGDEEIAAWVARTIAGIAAVWNPPGALDKLLPYTATRSARVFAQLLEVWGRHGDYQTYASTVLAEVNFRGIPVALQGVDRIRHISYLKTITDLTLRGDLGDLSPLVELPELRSLRLDQNTLVDLRRLVGCPALRVLQLAQSSSMAAVRPIDLGPLAEMKLDELIISGLLCKVDLASLENTTLQHLDLTNGQRGMLAKLPEQLNVHTISMNGLPNQAEVDALRRLRALRRLILCNVGPDAALPTIPGVQIVTQTEC